ncbi:hypothetical protein [Duganella callida]|uniref:Uncharacterized protein n=1 Tax=Duganella callida TaxID=2561932 RepID=A0A4Y9S1M7_9BURK|nr:hypothetical protein [Duganella callida]TFW13438.1 hypothetical protein E4L98_28950 [Duganella callida]
MSRESGPKRQHEYREFEHERRQTDREETDDAHAEPRPPRAPRSGTGFRRRNTTRRNRAS